MKYQGVRPWPYLNSQSYNFAISEPADFHTVSYWCYENGVKYLHESSSSRGLNVISIKNDEQRAWFIMKWC